MPRTIRLALALLVVVSAALLAACSGDDNNDNGTPSAAATEAQGGGAKSTPSASTTVNVTEKEYSITPDKGSASAGKVTFKVKNEGTMTHEFVVFRTDLPEGQLPVDASTSQVEEEGPGVALVDENEDIAKGKTESLAVDLSPGNYVLVCNIAGHYTLGMHRGFSVVTAGSSGNSTPSGQY